MLKLTTTIPIAHRVQQTNDELGELPSLMMEQNTSINQIGERVDSVRDEASVLTSRTIPATLTPQPPTALQQENQALCTALLVSKARVGQNNNPAPPGRGDRHGGGHGGGQGGAGRDGGRRGRGGR